MSAATFIVDCPVCRAKVAAEERGRAEHTVYDEEAFEPNGRRLYVGVCPRCSTLLAAEAKQIRFDGWEGEEADEWSNPVRVHPNPPKTFSSWRIPDTVTVSLTEGGNALQANAYIAACVMFGRALEAMCRDVLFTEEEKKAIAAGTAKKRLMLSDGIKELKAKNLIDDRLFDWSQQLHAFRNLAAHPDGARPVTTAAFGQEHAAPDCHPAAGAVVMLWGFLPRCRSAPARPRYLLRRNAS